MPGRKKKVSKKVGGNAPACCHIESVVTIDERGQMVLPKDLRQKAGIEPGDKLAVISWKDGERVCCLSMMKVGELSGAIGGMLGPLMRTESSD
jgi:antitoxin PrlF